MSQPLPNGFGIVAWPLLVAATLIVLGNYVILIRELVLAGILKRKIPFHSLIFVAGGLAGLIGSLLAPGTIGMSLRHSAWIWLLADFTIPWVILSLPWLLRGKRPPFL